MAATSSSVYECECGSIIAYIGRYQHDKTAKHINFILTQAGRTNELIRRKSKYSERIIGEIPDLNKALRYSSIELRMQPRVLAIQDLRNSIDSYTWSDITLEYGKLPEVYQVDHIHEVQVFVYAIKRVPALFYRTIKPIRTEVNDVSNLVITDASVNQSKGQAIKLFLSQLNTERETSLLEALISTRKGESRKIINFAARIVDVICKCSNIMKFKSYAHDSTASHK